MRPALSLSCNFFVVHPEAGRLNLTRSGTEHTSDDFPRR